MTAARRPRVVEALNGALHELMAERPRLHLIGEDLLDPYGGAFKVSRGLSTAFPERVLTTPISEASIVGFATGMAMQGWPAIAEIMFGDFVLLAMDQIVNQAAKMPWMYNEQVTIPLTIRAPMGGRRGYGATHSQSLEKHLCGLPGLTVLAVSQYGDPAELLRRAVSMGAPTVLIENKILYARLVEGADALPRPAAPDILLIAHGGAVEEAVAAASSLMAAEEIAAEVLALETLSPLPHGEIAAAAARVPCLLVVEEGPGGWGLAAAVAEAVVNLPVRMASLAAPAHPIPNSRAWELAVLPGADAIARAAVALLVDGRTGPWTPLELGAPPWA